MPARLGEKLLAARLLLGLPQEKMWEAVKTDETSDRSRISRFESGKLEPTTLELLKYTNLIRKETAYNIRMEHFAEDSMDLPFTVGAPEKQTKL